MKETFTWWNMSDSPLVANLPVTVNMYTLRYPAYVPSEKEVLIQHMSYRMFIHYY